MILVTGGAFQGKTEFVKKRFGLSDSDIKDCGSCDIPELENARCIKHYELAVKRLVSEGRDPLKFTEELDCDIILLDETGSGIIPLEKSERIWREYTGRCGCIAARRAEKVYRLCCGIPALIKGEEN